MKLTCPYVNPCPTDSDPNLSAENPDSFEDIYFRVSSNTLKTGPHNGITQTPIGGWGNNPNGAKTNSSVLSFTQRPGVILPSVPLVGRLKFFGRRGVPGARPGRIVQNGLPPDPVDTNDTVTCGDNCPTGQQTLWTVPKGTITGLTKAIANQKAYDQACANAVRYSACAGGSGITFCAKQQAQLQVEFSGYNGQQLTLQGNPGSSGMFFEQNGPNTGRYFTRPPNGLACGSHTLKTSATVVPPAGADGSGLTQFGSSTLDFAGTINNTIFAIGAALTVASQGQQCIQTKFDFVYLGCTGLESAFTIISGNLPFGISYNPASRRFSGTFLSCGTYTWTVQVTGPAGGVCFFQDSCIVASCPAAIIGSLDTVIVTSPYLTAAGFGWSGSCPKQIPNPFPPPAMIDLAGQQSAISGWLAVTGTGGRNVMITSFGESDGVSAVFYVNGVATASCDGSGNHSGVSAIGDANHPSFCELHVGSIAARDDGGSGFFSITEIC